MRSGSRLLLHTALLLLIAAPATAGLPKAAKKEAKAMTKGTLYMRIDAPAATGRHAYGTYKRPLVEVSPEGVNTDGDLAINSGWWHADSTYWGIGVNDSVEVDSIDFDDDAIEIEFEGVGAADGNSSTLLLVDVNSLEDFQAAFKRAFATMPLQDEHEDWSPEIRKAIGNRQLKTGMTKRQAYCITGYPESNRTFEENGQKIEVWTLRQSKGMKMGYWGTKGGESSGLPSTIRFVDGKIESIGKSEGGSEVSLDD